MHYHKRTLLAVWRLLCAFLHLFFFFLIHHYLTSWCFWNFQVTFYGGNVVCTHQKKCCLCSCSHIYFIFALPLAFLIFSPAAYKCFEFFSSKEIRLLWFLSFALTFFLLSTTGGRTLTWWSNFLPDRWVSNFYSNGAPLRVLAITGFCKLHKNPT